MVQLTFAGYIGTENNPKTVAFDVAFTGNYGTNLLGDPINFAPYNPSTNPTGVLDPDGAYNLILARNPGRVGIFAQDLGGSYINGHNLKPAVPSLSNGWGLRMYEPGGAEKATAAAYTATELAGTATLMLNIPTYQ